MSNIKQILCGMIMFLPAILCAQQGIRFEEGLTWQQVLEKAKKENKYIFVDCYATWCKPCKWMDQKVYSTDKVGNYFNEKFISVKVQMDALKSDNDFIRSWRAYADLVRVRYQVHAFPSYLFFTPTGTIVHKETGSKTPDNLITVGKEALDGNKQYYVLLEKYRRNELDATFIKYLARKAKNVESEELARKLANDYINGLTIDTLFTQDNIRFMYEFTRSSRDRGFVLFRDSAKRISETDQRINEGICKDLVLGCINNEEIKPHTSSKKGKPDWKRIRSNLKKYGSLGDEAFIKFQPEIIFKMQIEPALKINSDWDKILSLIEKQNLGKNAEFVVGSTIVYYLNGIAVHHTEKNCKNLVAAAKYYANSFSAFLNARALNSWAWVLFENSKDKDELKLALEWSKRSNDLEPNTPDFLDTYANVLYKLGFVNDAISWQQKAVEIAEDQAKKSNTTSRSVYREFLEKMKKGEKTWLDK